VYLYRWKCGWLLGHRFLLLIHVGRRTGLPRNTVLEVLEYRKEGPEAVVMSAFGPDADWLRNIEATPTQEVIIGSQRFIAVHRVLDEDEAVSVITGYEQRNWLIAPIIRWVLSRLLGWHYNGEMDQRRPLIAQLPCIAFRPAVMLHGYPAGGPARRLSEVRTSICRRGWGSSSGSVCSGQR
jgi:deazaflavin-dependent oxidoreductase (nitroreductase family)